MNYKENILYEVNGRTVTGRQLNDTAAWLCAFCEATEHALQQIGIERTVKSGNIQQTYIELELDQPLNGLTLYAAKQLNDRLRVNGRYCTIEQPGKTVVIHEA